jgi:ABC-type nitrate/sulfonate/bicarbonate transport system substrate-binding protein
VPPQALRIGMVRLTDAAPLVFAQAHDLFAAAELEVSIAVEPSWANVADKLAWSLLDGAVMLYPLAIAMALGLRGPATPLRIPAGISLNGNAITLSRPPRRTPAARWPRSACRDLGPAAARPAQGRGDPACRRARLLHP